jgi:uncharacterized pyridoxal phosphate-containing UPF0001 family protein
VLIQINISDEQSKSGISLAELDALAAQVVELPGLCLRGLMAIPAPESDYERQFAVARQMAVAFDALKNVTLASIRFSGHVGRYGSRHRGRKHDGAHRHRHFWCARLHKK